jgi:pimeloyl-ACP methyl ester carboxylesterase
MRPPPARLALGFVLGLALLGEPAACLAQQAQTEKVRFETIDQVELHGTFYASTKSKKAPCVLLLHKLGGSSSEEGWSQLAEELQKAGCAVLSFDFRGHGNSKAVGREFWNFPNKFFPYPPNAKLVKGYHPTNPKATIQHQDFDRSYLPNLVNDIIAAKLFLDRRNDAGECNSTNLILIGAEEGAALGAMWLASETYRYRMTNPPPVLKWDSNPQCREVVCAIWLSISPNLGNRPVPVLEWVRQAGRDQKIPTLLLHGDKDSPGATLAKRIKDAIRPTDKFTDAFAVQKAEKLAGHQLISKDLTIKVETAEKGKFEELAVLPAISSYVRNLVEKRKNEWGQQDLDRTGYVWVFPGNPLPLMAKQEREKTINPLPVDRMGIR